MIAAFGLAAEPEPGVIEIPDVDVRAVHITRLSSDGLDRTDKIMVGRGASGFPIVLAPPNDLLAIAITEGIEDALSVHEATGLGAWAAGAAGRTPTLANAVPGFIDFVTIVADRDQSGINGANGLSDGLRKRCIRHAVTLLDRGRGA